MRIPKTCKQCFILPVCLKKSLKDKIYDCSILNNYLFKNSFQFTYGTLDDGETLYELEKVTVYNGVMLFDKQITNQITELSPEDPRYIILTMKYATYQLGKTIIDHCDHEYKYQTKVL